MSSLYPGQQYKIRLFTDLSALCQSDRREGERIGQKIHGERESEREKSDMRNVCEECIHFMPSPVFALVLAVFSFFFLILFQYDLIGCSVTRSVFVIYQPATDYICWTHSYVKRKSVPNPTTPPPITTNKDGKALVLIEKSAPSLN